MTGLSFPDLIARMIHQESRGNPNAVSPVGAQGLMQVMPATAANPGFGIAPLTDPFNPVANRAFGEKYMQAMIDRYGGDQQRAAVAYNWGVGNADKWDGNVATLPAETRGYLSAIFGDGAAPVSHAPAGGPPPAVPPVGPGGMAPSWGETNPRVAFRIPMQPRAVAAQRVAPAAPPAPGAPALDIAGLLSELQAASTRPKLDHFTEGF